MINDPGREDVPDVNLDERVEVAPGMTKGLGDCTREDLQAAREPLTREAIRHQTPAESMSRGQALKWDWQEADGTYCEADADFIRAGGSDAGPRSLCTKHAQASGAV